MSYSEIKRGHIWISRQCAIRNPIRGSQLVMKRWGSTEFQAGGLYSFQSHVWGTCAPAPWEFRQSWCGWNIFRDIEICEQIKAVLDNE